MLRWFLRYGPRLAILSLFVVLGPVALLNRAHASSSYGGIAIPPAEVRYFVPYAGLGSTGATLRWWQASNADQVVLIEHCGAGQNQDLAIGYEPGQPGWHERHIWPDNLRSCVWIREFYQGELLGDYRPYPLELLRLNLPILGKRQR